MKKLLYIILSLFATIGLTYGQAIVSIQNGCYIVENGGTAASPVYIATGNSATNAFTTTGTGWIISENEFNMVEWNINTATGTYLVPFGYSTAQYLPLTLNVSTAGTGNGVVKFSTYHSAALNTPTPSDVTNLNAFILPGSPTNADDAYNIVDRFYVIDANTGYTTKPAAGNITFSYISGTANSEVAAPNILNQPNLMGERFNSTTGIWSDWFGEGCTDAIIGNVGTVQTGPVPAIDMFRSWTLWDNLTPLPLTTTSTNVLCNGTGGSATVNVYGGVNPYTYSWSPGGNTNANATGLSAGTYTVTVKDNHGCTSTASTIVTQISSPITISIASKTTLLCEGMGTITAHPATGGTSPYTYLWSPSGGTNLTTITTLTAGTYTITATDSNGCTASASETISYPPHLNVTSNVTANPNCFGGRDGSASSTVTGGTPAYTYAWFPGGGTNANESGLSAGTYTITITDSLGCTASSTIVITQPAGMVIMTDSMNVTTAIGGLCNGEASVTVLSGGTPPYTYLWSPGGQTTDTIKSQCAGVYCCDVTDKNGCMQSTCIIVTSTVGIDNISDGSSVNIYPNPSTGQFTIAGIEAGMMVEMYDYTGRRISNEIAADISMQLNITDKANGIYLIRILSKDGNLVTNKKVIKTQ